jgi:hypothetical protein
MYDYHQEADILEVFFAEAEATVAVHLTQDIILHIRLEDEQATSLIFNNFSHLVQPDEYGQRSFRLQIEQWSEALRPVVWRLLNIAPLNEWLEITTYHPPRNRQAVPLVRVKQTELLKQAA